MKKQFILLVSAITLFLVAVNCNAEPSHTIKYLMNTNVSMFDFGLYKLQTGLQDYSEHLAIADRSPIIKVLYSKDRNKIIIAMAYFFLPFDAKDTETVHFKSEIEDKLKKVKKLFYSEDNQIYSIKHMFSRYGIDDDKRIGNDLNSSTIIDISILTPKQKYFNCVTGLTSNNLKWFER
ncbi:hypothetical protein ACFL5W_01625 [Thermodesulfobacteriota bacterium]